MGAGVSTFSGLLFVGIQSPESFSDEPELVGPFIATTAILGSILEAMTIPFKKSRKYQIDGDVLKWKELMGIPLE